MHVDASRVGRRHIFMMVCFAIPSIFSIIEYESLYLYHVCVWLCGSAAVVLQTQNILLHGFDHRVVTLAADKLKR